MPLSREMDESGLRLCRKQALVFVESRRLPIGSADFIRRYCYTEYCWCFDSLACYNLGMEIEPFLEEFEATLPKGSKAPKWNEDELHWIGYVYRYWAYIDCLPMKAIYRKFPATKMRAFYPAYHSLDPQTAIDIWKEEFGLGRDEQDMLELFRKVERGEIK
ncbi:MAG: hypothetical protein IJS37_01065 [Bacilli bacterium]|nr:hypothetical protein [Bacilli bacterium]